VIKSEPEIARDSRDEFDNSFDVPLPPAKAWPLLTDILAAEKRKTCAHSEFFGF